MSKESNYINNQYQDFFEKSLTVFNPLAYDHQIKCFFLVI